MHMQADAKGTAMHMNAAQVFELVAIVSVRLVVPARGGIWHTWHAMWNRASRFPEVNGVVDLNAA